MLQVYIVIIIINNNKLHLKNIYYFIFELNIQISWLFFYFGEIYDNIWNRYILFLYIIYQFISYLIIFNLKFLSKDNYLFKDLKDINDNILYII